MQKIAETTESDLESISNIDDEGLYYEIGTDILETFTEAGYADHYTSLQELAVANPWDADSHNTRIMYSSEEDFIEISDDGIGMRKNDGLRGFFRAGDSRNKTEPISPGKRKRLGRFGFATLMIKSLCRNFEIDTVKDGVRTKVTQEFRDDEPLTLRKRLDDDDVVETPIDPSYHGTCLTLKGLKFRRKDFSIERLIEKIQWNFGTLLTPDFRFFVNDNEVRSPSIDGAKKFLFERKGNEMGNITGEIFYSKNPIRQAGVYITINGRAYGVPKDMLLELSDNRSMQARTIAIVHANSLEDSVIVNRNVLRETAGITELKGTISQEIRKVAQSIRTDRSRRDRTDTIERNKDAMATKVKGILVGADILPRYTSMEFSDRLGDERLGQYDKENRKLLLNPNHPALLINPDTTAQSYKIMILNSAIDVIALDEAKGNLGIYCSSIRRLWQTLQSRGIGDERKSVITSNRFYSLHEMSALSQRSVRSLKHLIEGGLLKITNDGILGEDFKTHLAKLEGLVVLYDFALENTTPGTTDAFYKRIVRVLDEAGKTIEPFAYRFSEASEPLYLVEGYSSNDLRTLFKDPRSDKRTSKYDPKKPFEELKSCRFTIPELVKELDNNISIEDATRVINNASKRGDNLGLQTTVKNELTYSYERFVREMQYHRGNREIIEQRS